MAVLRPPGNNAGTNPGPKPAVGPNPRKRTIDQQREASNHPSNCTPLSHPDHDQAVVSSITRLQSRKTPQLPDVAFTKTLKPV
ncbi:MAG: hypothetical protein ACFE89_08205 [Candidatus Hodarchaeota archaeon]